MVRPVSGDMEDFYELENEDQYSDEMGLNLGIESGMALFGWVGREKKRAEYGSGDKNGNSLTPLQFVL